jgi:hypothetical protein
LQKKITRKGNGNENVEKKLWCDRKNYVTLALSIKNL